MGLRLEDKQAIVTEVQAVAQTAHSVVAAEYRGLTVSQLTGLRAQARQAGVYMRVVKNTLVRRAVAGTPYECIAKSLKGPLILAFFALWISVKLFSPRKANWNFFHFSWKIAPFQRTGPNVVFQPIS